MNAQPQSLEAILRINRELLRTTNAAHGLSIAETRSALAVSNACSTFRRIRTELDQCMVWLDEHARELVPLFLLLVQVADAACRGRAAER